MHYWSCNWGWKRTEVLICCNHDLCVLVVTDILSICLQIPILPKLRGWYFCTHEPTNHGSNHNEDNYSQDELFGNWSNRGVAYRGGALLVSCGYCHRSSMPKETRRCTGKLSASQCSQSCGVHTLLSMTNHKVSWCDWLNANWYKWINVINPTTARVPTPKLLKHLLDSPGQSHAII